MKQTKICKICGKEFITFWDCKYCSRRCYFRSRWGNDKFCKSCGKRLRKDQFRYCSNKCIKDYWNKNDYHLRKKKIYWEQKINIIKELGGKCRKCGITDIRVLDINHIDRERKKGR